MQSSIESNHVKGQHVVRLIKHLSKRSLLDNGKLTELELRDLTPSIRPPVLAHWMCAILLAGPALRLTFRAHFLTEKIRHIVGNALQKESRNLGDDLIRDFVREFCNLTTGRLKRSLEKNQMDLGISIPLVVRGFDEVFTPTPDGQKKVVESWILESPKGSLLCSLYFELLDPAGLSFLTDEAVSKMIAAESARDSEIEFL